MTRLLHIDASPRGARSRSRTIATHLLDRLTADDPALSIERLDLWTTELPPFDDAVVEGRYRLLHGEAVAEAEAERWAAVERVARHLLSFDLWLLSVPMWNFGIPYRLKHYVDLVTQPGMTFRNDAVGNVEGLAAGRTAIVVAASAMDIGAGRGLAHLDFQLRYLETWLAFIGVADIHTLRVAPTFGPVETVDGAMTEARAAADAIARAVHAAGRQ